MGGEGLSIVDRDQGRGRQAAFGVLSEPEFAQIPRREVHRDRLPHHGFRRDPPGPQIGGGLGAIDGGGRAQGGIAEGSRGGGGANLRIGTDQIVDVLISRAVRDPHSPRDDEAAGVGQGDITFQARLLGILTEAIAAAPMQEHREIVGTEVAAGQPS